MPFSLPQSSINSCNWCIYSILFFFVYFSVFMIHCKFTYGSHSRHSFECTSLFFILYVNSHVLLPGTGNHFFHKYLFPEWLPFLWVNHCANPIKISLFIVSNREAKIRTFHNWSVISSYLVTFASPNPVYSQGCFVLLCHRRSKFTFQTPQDRHNVFTCALWSDWHAFQHAKCNKQ